MDKKTANKRTIDQLIKYVSLCVIYVIAIIVVVFSALSIQGRTRLSSDFGSSYTTNVYVVPYNLSDKKDGDLSFDQLANNPYTGEQLIKNRLDNNQLDNQLEALQIVYKTRLALLGYQEPQVSSPINNVVVPNNLLASSSNPYGIINPSWLIDRSKTSSLAITVSQPSNVAIENSTNLINQYVHDQLLLSNRLSLETTDGVVLVSEDDITPGSFNVGRDASQSAIASSEWISFELKNTVTDDKTSPLGQILKLVDDPNAPVRFSSPSSFYSANSWNGIANNPAAEALIIGDGSQLRNIASGDRILILWNDKTEALNYARRILVTYLKERSNPTKLKQDLSSLEIKFGEFLTDNPNADSASDIEIMDKQRWKSLQGFSKNPNWITQALLGYFCLKSDSAVGANSVSLTKFAPLFSRYIVTYLRVGTGTESKDKKSGILWKNTTDFDSFFSHKSLNFPMSGEKVIVNKMYLPPSQIDLANPSASLTTFNSAVAKKYCDLFQYTSFPSDVHLFYTNYIPSGPQNIQSNVVNTQFLSSSVSTFPSSFPPLSSLAVVGISLGVIFFVLGVCLTFLYRLSGLMAWFSAIVNLVVTFALFFKFNGIFSVYTVFGLLTLAMLQLFCWIRFFEMFRSNLKRKLTVPVAFKNASKKSFMPTLDKHIFVLLFGIPLLFVGKYIEQGYSVILILGAFFSFIFWYIVGLLPIKLFLNNHEWKSSRYLTYGNYDITFSHQFFTSTEINTDASTQLTQFSNTNWFVKKRWPFAVSLTLVLAFAIAGIFISQFVQIIPVNFADVIISNTVAPIVVSGVGGLIYLLFRYSFVSALPFLLNIVLILFILFGFSFVVFLSSYQIRPNDVILLMSLYILSMLQFHSLLDTYCQNFSRSHILSNEEMNQTLNLSAKDCFSINLFSFSALLVSFNLFFLFNIGSNGDYNFRLMDNMLLFNVTVVFFIFVNCYVSPFILSLALVSRNSLSAKNLKVKVSHNKHEWKNINYDDFDEQLIRGINSRD